EPAKDARKGDHVRQEEQGLPEIELSAGGCHWRDSALVTLTRKDVRLVDSWGLLVEMRADLALGQGGSYPCAMRYGVPARLVCASVLTLGSLGSLAACAHADSAADRHVREMRESISRIEAEQDRAYQRFEGVSEEATPPPAQRGIQAERPP